MKKVISVLVLGVLLLGLLAPAVSLAQPEVPQEECLITRNIGIAACPENTTVGPGTTDEWGMCCLINSVYNVTDWIFYLLMVFVVVMVVIGGATYMLASGDPEKAGKGKSIIIYGIVGLVIALLARLIPSIVKLIVGM